MTATVNSAFTERRSPSATSENSSKMDRSTRHVKRAGVSE